jgi:hypothetical protein
MVHTANAITFDALVRNLRKVDQKLCLVELVKNAPLTFV